MAGDETQTAKPLFACYSGLTQEKSVNEPPLDLVVELAS